MSEREAAVRAAFAHIVDAASCLSRNEAMIAATALRAGWLSDEERAAFTDLANGFDRLANAGAKS